MICNLCKKEIDVTEERYVHVEDWNKQKMTKEMWAHLNCFNRAMNRELTQLEKQAQAMLKKAGNIFDSDSFNEMFPKKKEEFVIT